jgi:hypothetical protein
MGTSRKHRPVLALPLLHPLADGWPHNLSTADGLCGLVDQEHLRGIAALVLGNVSAMILLLPLFFLA